jgi:hypothetical protein
MGENRYGVLPHSDRGGIAGMKSRDSLPEAIGMIAVAVFFAVLLMLFVSWCVQSFSGSFAPRRRPPSERMSS